jgi:hypothetical protein
MSRVFNQKTFEQTGRGAGEKDRILWDWSTDNHFCCPDATPTTSWPEGYTCIPADTGSRCPYVNADQVKCMVYHGCVKDEDD